MSVIYIKLFTGEDIVATMTSETENNIIITNPVAIRTRYSEETNRIMIGIQPWIPIQELMNCEYNIQKNNMIAVTEVPPNILYNYTRMIGELQTEHESQTVPSADMFSTDDDDSSAAVSNTTNRILH